MGLKNSGQYIFVFSVSFVVMFFSKVFYLINMSYNCHISLIVVSSLRGNMLCIVMTPDN